MSTQLPEAATANSSAASQQKAAGVLMGVSYLLGAVGIYFGFASISGGTTSDFALFVLLAVGGPTVAGFIRHFFLWRGDMVRLGFETSDPSWMWEVAFANLAFACGAILSFALKWGESAQAVVAIMMGVYMLGATFVHVRSSRGKAATDRRNAFMHIWVPAIYAAILLSISLRTVA